MGHFGPLFCCLLIKFMHKDQVENIRSLILPELEQEDVELVDIELKGKYGSQVLRIFVDTPNGISLDRCADLSRMISDVLDIKDPINSKYTLEVSSPGLNRPLKSLRDFQRKLGNRVRIIYFENERTQTIEGVIENIDQDRGVKINNGTDTISIALDKIRKAKIILKW